MRWFLADPISDDLMESLVWAATRAGSAHNSEPWDIVVIRRPDLRSAIAKAIAEAVALNDPMPVAESASDRRIELGVRDLFAQHV